MEPLLRDAAPLAVQMADSLPGVRSADKTHQGSSKVEALSQSRGDGPEDRGIVNDSNITEDIHQESVHPTDQNNRLCSQTVMSANVQIDFTVGSAFQTDDSDYISDRTGEDVDDVASEIVSEDEINLVSDTDQLHVTDEVQLTPTRPNVQNIPRCKYEPAQRHLLPETKRRLDENGQQCDSTSQGPGDELLNTK